MNKNLVNKTYLEFRDAEAVFIDHTHIKAEYVARMHVNGGATIEEVMEQYGLTRAEVYAALTYFYDNQNVLDTELQRFWNEAKASGKTAEDLRAKIEARRRGKQD